MIAIIDYGAGNIGSVKKAVEYAGGEAVVTADHETIRTADGIIFPGVGAFGDAMRQLEAKGLCGIIRECIESGRPFLGICLGMQMLFERSEEAPGVAGLGVLGGDIVRFAPDMGLKVPHIGWNSIDYDRDCPLFAGLPEKPYVYFVHSYYLKAKDEGCVSARADYGHAFHAAVWRGSCFATQFHPEKSGQVGLTMLKNFVGLTKED